VLQSASGTQFQTGLVLGVLATARALQLQGTAVHELVQQAFAEIMALGADFQRWQNLLKGDQK